MKGLRFLLAMTVWSVSGCAVLGNTDASRAHVLFYNVQNLFDATFDGNEYYEFTPAAGWTAAHVTNKLRSVASAVQSVRPRPDIVALAEVENADVAVELFGRFLPDLRISDVVSTDQEDGTINLVVGSRWPISDVRVHRPILDESTVLRPTLEVWIEPVSGHPIVLLVNHWKSRREGVEETEPYRRAAAGLVARRVGELARMETAPAVVVLGDFNEDPTMVNTYVNTSADLVSLWDQVDEPGTYVYDGNWYRYDAAFVGPNLFDGAGWEVGRFSPVVNEYTADADGIPRRWIPTVAGVSDHLPISLQLEFVEE